MAHTAGWKKLIEGYPWFQGQGQFPLPAYSEFMPPPRLGLRPYGEKDPLLYAESDPYGWNILEIEQEYEIKPGLAIIGREVVDQLAHLGRGEPAYKITGHEDCNIENNPYWPKELAQHAGHLDHERYVVLLPLALSRTQDDMGRVRWTLFGNSEQGPERAFWKSFYRSPDQELPEAQFARFVRRLLAEAFGHKTAESAPLSSLGLRILPSNKNDQFPYWNTTLPSWTHDLIIGDDASLKGVEFLLTFRPFASLPQPVKNAYFRGRLALLPFPGSLVFWGMPNYLKLQAELPFALQVPLQIVVERHDDPRGIRVPQSAWLHEPGASKREARIREELLLNTARRTSRWDRVRRDEDQAAASKRVDHLTRVLFSTQLDAIGLYDKPEARNVQLWTEGDELLLDGPHAQPEDIKRAADHIVEGGTFRYRFQFPPMQVGPYAIYWHLPLVAYFDRAANQPRLVTVAPAGYLTAYLDQAPDLAHSVELWPRLVRRSACLAALLDKEKVHEHYQHQTALNVLSILDNRELLGKPLSRTFARQMLRLAEHLSLEAWLVQLPQQMEDPDDAECVCEELSRALEPADQKSDLPTAITYSATANRAFEVAYWDDIVSLSHPQFETKDNADVIEDKPTEEKEHRRTRDLERLGDYLIERHQKSIAEAGMQGKAFVGELPFRWETDLNYKDFGGWQGNQDGRLRERDILVVIPGKNRAEAVVMADHYDTAYMEDVFDKPKPGAGARMAARGADDNASATATLLNAAPLFLQLAKEGKLERDIWLLHLTGEEFPSDCLGARYFARALVEGTLKLHTPDKEIDLTGTRVIGVYVMDMIAHNRDDARDIFQISPGRGPGSLRLALHAYIANELWNQQTVEWNEGPERKGKARGQRSKDDTIPEIARYPRLDGQVRTGDDPQSSIYNTDGIIFSDIGAPVVLFMEDYDINRSGYHDTHDTMQNIDLDYGAALARICIETVAQVASEK